MLQIRDLPTGRRERDRGVGDLLPREERLCDQFGVNRERWRPASTLVERQMGTPRVAQDLSGGISLPVVYARSEPVARLRPHCRTRRYSTTEVLANISKAQHRAWKRACAN
jgi:hypothetical protein